MSLERVVEEQTGRLYGDLWHRYDDELFKQSVLLFEKRWRENGEASDFFHGKRCLDVGCGGGRYSFAMALMGASSVVGVDVGEAGLEDARRRGAALGLSQVSFRQASVLNLPFPAPEFDFICCSGVLHHTPGIERGLSELHRVSRPGASLYLLLYGAGGLYWPLNLAMRPYASLLGQAEVDRSIAAAGFPANKRRTILDSLFCPILETYTRERVDFLLAGAGFARWRRWGRGQFDHEASPERLVQELEIYVRLWQEGARTSPDREKARIESHLADLCRSVVAGARELLEQHERGQLSAEQLREAIIGTGHQRLIAERS